MGKANAEMHRRAGKGNSDENELTDGNGLRHGSAGDERGLLRLDFGELELARVSGTRPAATPCVDRLFRCDRRDPHGRLHRNHASDGNRSLSATRMSTLNLRTARGLEGGAGSGEKGAKVAGTGDLQHAVEFSADFPGILRMMQHVVFHFLQSARQVANG